MDDCPENTIPLKLQQYLTTENPDKSIRLIPYRYEYWVYSRLNEHIKTGKVYLEDSLQYRSLSQELVSLEKKMS